MARRNHLDNFTCGRLIGKLEEGRTVTSVAAEFGINKSVVSRAWKAFQTTGTAVRKVGGGRPRTTTAGDDRNIMLQAKRGRRQSASVIAQQWATSVAVYCSQTPSQRGPIRPPSCPVPLKTRRVGQRCTLNLSRAETSSRWCGVVVRRGGASSGVVHVT
ncbi:transposable element Tcb2 transposase [Trichonephila clavipes]|uniref:Transposable element Tcb2 transposase n=1 Tax=Trichonephila clavipes TaxID=2585209 RepID=A0A8X6VFZ6_TRICX|nr:transposable element Tcb2 transposase [Trichonephila clavipes]